MKITILCTNENHPVNSWLHKWMLENSERHQINLVRKSIQLDTGDILFLISCHEKITKEIRGKFRFTLVLHASPLPMGRGMSPHIWQILEGKNELTLSLLNAEDELDAGDIWTQIPIKLDGSELFNEINEKVFSAEIEAMTWAVNNINKASPFKQHGKISFYKKRTPEDSQLDPKKSIAEQFNLLRIADPNRYPAFFEINRYKYKIHIERYDAK